MSELTTVAVVVMIMVWFSYTAAEWTITPTGLSLNGMLVMLNRTQRAVVSTTPATTLITTNQMLLLMQVSSHNTTTHIMIQSLIQISILRYANLSNYIHIIIYSRYFILLLIISVVTQWVECRVSSWRLLRMTLSDSISPHIDGGEDRLCEFGPAVACADVLDDASMICWAVDRVTSRCGSAKLGRLE